MDWYAASAPPMALGEKVRVYKLRGPYERVWDPLEYYPTNYV